MREVSDIFLLNMAQVSGALLGLFVVGMLFYVETGFRRVDPRGGEALEAYFRASTRIVLLLFVIPLSLSMTLVVLDPGWSAAFFGLLSTTLVAANIDTVRRLGAVQGGDGSRLLVVNEAAGTAAVIVLVVLPWVLGGTSPSREDLTWAILLSFATAVASIFVLVLSVFDLASTPQRLRRRSRDELDA
jgi:hypothetical protein